MIPLHPCIHLSNFLPLLPPPFSPPRSCWTHSTYSPSRKEIALSSSPIRTGRIGSWQSLPHNKQQINSASPPLPPPPPLSPVTLHEVLCSFLKILIHRNLPPARGCHRVKTKVEIRRRHTILRALFRIKWCSSSSHCLCFIPCLRLKDCISLSLSLSLPATAFISPLSISSELFNSLSRYTSPSLLFCTPTYTLTLPPIQGPIYKSDNSHIFLAISASIAHFDEKGYINGPQFMRKLRESLLSAFVAQFQLYGDCVLFVFNLLFGGFCVIFL